MMRKKDVMVAYDSLDKALNFDEVSGDTTPFRMTGVTLRSRIRHYQSDFTQSRPLFSSSTRFLP